MLTYVHKFNSESAYNNYMNTSYQVPFVSATDVSGNSNVWASYRTDYEIRPVDLSELDINGKPSGNRETANCYVVHNTGWYEFPLVYGCALSGGTVHTPCYTRSPLSGVTYS